MSSPTPSVCAVTAVTGALEDELQPLDFDLTIADSHGDAEREARRLQTLRGQQVQGIILVAADTVRSSEAVRALSPSMPMVCVDRRVDFPGVDYVGVDNAQGIRLVLDHLADRGTRTVALASSDNVTSAGRERHLEFDKHARELGLVVLDPVIRAFDVDTGLFAGEVFGALSTLPDAIVAGDDLIAIGLISSLSARGVRVPDDVLITGFDDTYLSVLVEPGITTVEQPVREIAALAVEALMRRRRTSNGDTSSVVVAPTLAVRGSTTVAWKPSQT